MWVGAAVRNQSVLATSFALDEGKVLENLLKSIPYNVPFQVVERTAPFSERVLSALETILGGEKPDSKFNLDTTYLSGYARKVLRCVSLIPIGYVTTYGEVAKTIGGSPRAVGRVMAINPFPPLVPCHRVVRSDFTLGGFGLGVDLKWEILQRENRGYTQKKKIEVNGKTLFLFPINFLRKERKQHNP
jgi:methylated-DNA-[protein]-cysteine S-methyltransferase